MRRILAAMIKKMIWTRVIARSTLLSKPIPAPMLSCLKPQRRDSMQ